MNVSASLEDYLEAIHLLKESQKVVRVKDLAEWMGVKAPSVNEALKALKDKALIEQERYGHIDLTPAGTKIAKSVYGKHHTLKLFLEKVLGLDEGLSDQEACKIEHYLERETIRRMGKFMEYSQNCLRVKETNTCQLQFDVYLKSSSQAGAE